jgi:hypothetical protein
LGLGAASAAAQYVVTHPQTSHNPINLVFLLDPLSKSELLSFLILYPFYIGLALGKGKKRVFLRRIILKESDIRCDVRLYDFVAF